jgi:ABC-2 type transport system permease protein
MAEVKKRLDSGKAKVALIIPPEFTRNLADGRPAPIQFLSDGSDTNQAGQAVGFAKRIIGTYNRKIIFERLNMQGIMISDIPLIHNELRILFNQEMEGVYYIVIYHIVAAGLIGGLILSSNALIREKERGTIDQLLVTPIRAWELLVAKTIVPILIGLIATVFSFLVVVWFDVPFRGNPLVFFAYMGFFLFAMTGIGICVGAICQNMLQAILLCFVLFFGVFFVSGIFTPLSNMLPFLQKIAQFLPPTHFNISANAIFQKGVGFSILWPEAVKLVGIGLGFFSIGWYFNWRQFR